MQQHCRNYLARRPPPLPSGSKGQNSNSSEHGHVAYQIKGNHECSNNVVGNILPADHLHTQPSGSNVQNSPFSEHGHIKLTTIFYLQTHTHFPHPRPGGCQHPHPRPGGWGQLVKIQLFQNMDKLHIK